MADSSGWPRDWSAEPGSRILITKVLNPALKGYEGKTVAEIARDERKDPLDALMDIVIADRANTGRVTFSMSEEDVKTALAHPLVSMGTDSGAKAEDGIYSEEKSHPRALRSVFLKARSSLGRFFSKSAATRSDISVQSASNSARSSALTTGKLGS